VSQIELMQPKTESISRAAARALRKGILPHVPPPASPVSTRVTLELEAGPQAYPEISFTDPMREEGWQVAMQAGEAVPGKTSVVWTAEILLPQAPTMLYYHFLLADGTRIRERRQKEGVERPQFGVWDEQDFRIAVYLPDGAPPAWTRGQVIYQIVPDRFARGAETPRIDQSYQHKTLHLAWGDPPEHPPKSRDFYGGNLQGVIQKLDYLQDLGVSCIYFTPIFASPTNHRYDALNYRLIDPQLGTLEDLQELINQAGQRGIRVMLDGVFNHCSSDSIYFKEAQASKLSPYYRWFHFNHWPDDYVGWLKVKTMPEFVECPEVEAFFFGDDGPERGIAQYWLSFGTAGWRTDVTPWITGRYWRRFRAAVRKAFPEAFLVAEDWGDASKRLLGDSFDATMNYRFCYTVVGFAGSHINPLELDDRLETLRRDTPPGPFHAQLNLLDSHDTARAFTLLKKNHKRMVLSAALQLAYPGMPMLYSGDEAGQEGAYAENSRRAYPWDNPDPALLDFYRRAIKMRRQSQALSVGEVETVWIDPRGGYGFLRREGGEAVLALFNNGSRALRAEIAVSAPDGEWPDLLGLLAPAAIQNGLLKATLPPLGAGWYQITPGGG